MRSNGKARGWHDLGDDAGYFELPRHEITVGAAGEAGRCWQLLTEIFQVCLASWRYASDVV